MGHFFYKESLNMGPVFYQKKSLNMGPIFWLTQIFGFLHGENSKNHKNLWKMGIYFMKNP